MMLYSIWYRIYCRNNQDVTHMVPRTTGYIKTTPVDADLNSDSEAIMYIEFSWQCGSGQMIRILAHVSTPPNGRQYELFIDGQPFSSLPRICDLGAKDYKDRCFERKQYALIRRLSEYCLQSERSYDATNASHASSRHRHHSEAKCACAGTKSSRDHFDNDSSGVQLRDRLATVGLSIHQNQDAVDELTMQSDYTNSLETLRDDLISSLPELEDIMSLAIINAFSREEQDDQGIGWSDSNGTSSKSAVAIEPTDPVGIEAEALGDAYDWMARKGSSGNPRREAFFHSEKLSFLQGKVTEAVAHVRHGQLSALEASRVVQGVATVLGMQLALPLPRNTIILTKLPSDVSCGDVSSAMQAFGAVDAVGLASSRSGFAICRYRSPDEAMLAIDTGIRGDINIDGIRPSLLELHAPVDESLLSDESTTDNNLRETVTPDRTWDDEDINADEDPSYIYKVLDPLQSSSHSAELPPMQSSGHIYEEIPACVTDVEPESPTSTAVESPASNRTEKRHHRKRSTAIFDGEPRTYTEVKRDFSPHHGSTDVIEVCLRERRNGGCTFEDPSFAEIYRQEQANEDAPVHVLYIPESS
mmetsp:Transcript_3808/g.7428  ORF Transcript_3808/g.7428 Transcript_3808/m.7428 type:complete len:586 (-) Transcript_3808:784-2541(-)